MGCIYRATSKTSKKAYTGKTLSTMQERKCDHIRQAKKGSKLPFHCALRKYGFDDFVWDILFVSTEVSLLNNVEILEISIDNTKVPYGYNLTDGGDGGNGHTPETLAKISAALKGRRLSPETIAKMQATRRRMQLTPEAIAKRQATRIARAAQEKIKRQPRILSIEHRQKISKSLLGKKRKPLSKEHKTKVSQGLLGSRRTPESKAKMAAARKQWWARHPGRKHSEEHKRKIGNASRGKKRPPMPDETKKKISRTTSKSIKLWWAARKANQSARSNTLSRTVAVSSSAATTAPVPSHLATTSPSC